MRTTRKLLTTAVCSCLIPALAACSAAEKTPAGQSPQSETAAPTAAAVATDGLELDARPQGAKVDKTAACPYLDTQFIAQTNGERVMATAVDNRFNPAGCLWYSYQEYPQVQVVVRQATSEQNAIDIVGAAMTHPGTMPDQGTITLNPDKTMVGGTVEPTQIPAGWTGYRAHTQTSAAYAIRKGLTVVVVHSTQAQTIKVQKIAEEAVKNLGL